MYWLEPGTSFDSKSGLHFAGLHSLAQQVYFQPNQPALAVLVQQPVEDEMSVTCTGDEAVCSLQLARKRVSYVRIVSLDAATNVYKYHGVWLITEIDEQSKDRAQVSMISMPALP